jgi:hypothetical protein
MNDSDTKNLCLSLLNADTQNEVITLLGDAGLWEKPAAWRLFGDNENNYSTIGNQQSRSDAALVEKLVNSVDAILMNECLVRGIHPDGPDAPPTISEAVSKFFADGTVEGGRISLWSNVKRTEVARRITLAATGLPPRQGKPCFTVSDSGEGQTPERMADTLLSINRSNKLRIPFVQGKFNMGGTGSLKFCGKHGIQLTISRRNPKLISPAGGHHTDSMWGFTVVRREDPADGRRSSVYTYLAPMGCDSMPMHGGVLRFKSDSLPLFPEGPEAYAISSEWGTLIKLYEYTNSGYGNSHILMPDGLLARMDLLLPEIALPIRMHECRNNYKGDKSRSFETTLSGLRVRLEDDKTNNLEAECRSTAPLSVVGEECVASIYAFKPGKADTYRKSEGVLFTLNGQTHGALTKDFFTRKSVGRLSYIKDSVLLLVDCSKFSGRAREDFFLNSRDRISGAELRFAIEDALEDLLKHDQALRELVNRRRQEQIQANLADDKPLMNLLENVLKKSPTLSKLFLVGERLSNPFSTQHVSASPTAFHGKVHPTFFKFKGKDYGHVLDRDCALNVRLRVSFETDVVSEYFDRAINRGTSSVREKRSDGRESVANAVGPMLQNGIATLSVRLPEDATPGEIIEYSCEINDPTLLEPFVNVFKVHVKDAIEKKKGNGGNRREPPSKDKGDDRDTPLGIKLPNIKDVYEDEWPAHDFDKYSALKVTITAITVNGKEQDAHDFFVNADNIYLQTELKAEPASAALIRERFRLAMVLIGLAILQDDASASKEVETEDDADERGVEKRILEVTRAIAPVILPMISALSELDDHDLAGDANAGAES